MHDSFYSMKMRADEQPSEFILTIEEHRRELERCGYPVSHRRFIERIIQVGPYVIKTIPAEGQMRMWKKKLSVTWTKESSSLATSLATCKLTVSDNGIVCLRGGLRGNERPRSLQAT